MAGLTGQRAAGTARGEYRLYMPYESSIAATDINRKLGVFGQKLEASGSDS